MTTVVYYGSKELRNFLWNGSSINAAAGAPVVVVELKIVSFPFDDFLFLLHRLTGWTGCSSFPVNLQLLVSVTLGGRVQMFSYCCCCCCCAKWRGWLSLLRWMPFFCSDPKPMDDGTDDGSDSFYCKETRRFPLRYDSFRLCRTHGKAPVRLLWWWFCVRGKVELSG